MSRLRITEIFFSLQGETRTVGLPTVFVRLTGCPLRCGYCDTAYAFSGGSFFAVKAFARRKYVEGAVGSVAINAVNFVQHFYHHVAAALEKFGVLFDVILNSI